LFRRGDYRNEGQNHEISVLASSPDEGFCNTVDNTVRIILLGLGVIFLLCGARKTDKKILKFLKLPAITRWAVC
jgi:hypothetical protein